MPSGRRSKLPELRGRVAAADHAFASGGVFRCPSDLAEAVAMAGSDSEGALLFDVWRQFLTNGNIGDNVLLGLAARLVRDGNDAQGATIAHDSVIRGIIRTELSASVDIGPFVYLGDNSIMYARESVTIGAGTLIAHNVNIFDNDTHPIDAGERFVHFQRLLGYTPGSEPSIRAAPVRIGQRCWLAINTLVCKGVTIGDDTIVAANSVVTTDLPSNVLAAGNPAVPIRDLPANPREAGAQEQIALALQAPRPVARLRTGRYVRAGSNLRRLLRRLLHRPQKRN